MSDVDKLKEALEATISHMEQKGILPKLSVDEKKSIVDEVTNVVEEAFGADNVADKLRDDKIRKTITNAIVLSATNTKDPTFKFDLSVLFDEKADEKKLSSELKKAFMKLYKLEPDSKKSKEMENSVDEYCERLSKEMKNELEEKEEIVAQNQNSLSIFSILSSMLSMVMSPKGQTKEDDEAIMQFYGGQDPRFPGAISSVVLSVNESVPAWPDVGQGLMLGTVAEQFRSTAGDDPTGVRMMSEQRLLSFTGTSADFQKECLSEGLISAHDTPKLTRNGQH